MAVFQRCAKVLDEELGVEPSADTQHLLQKLTSGEMQLRPHKREVKPSSPVKLPIQPTPFVGREAELAQLDTLLSDPTVRLVTILGPGGMGKTRLAIEAARAQAEAFAAGVYFVSLASLDDAGFISSQIAETLGITFHVIDQREQWEYDTQIEQLLAYLTDKQLLLLLDNTEHLLSPVPNSPSNRWEKNVDHLIHDILQSASEVTILTTSRERLNLHGEVLLPLDGLIIPELKEPLNHHTLSQKNELNLENYDAVELFRQAASRVRADFALKSNNLADVIDICHLVEGMPLAIELAATWAELLSPADIVAEIRKSLDFLETSLGNIPDRQRSIRLVFGATWERLAQTEQMVFQRLSIFRGGFTREAAQNITGASLRTLMTLVNKSLLRPDLTGRYHLHELLRQFGRERLAQDPAIETEAKDRHCAYFVTFLQQKEPNLNGLNQMQALADIELEIDNVRAAWQWAMNQNQWNNIEQAMDSLCDYHRIRGRIDEGMQFFIPAAMALGWDSFAAAEAVPSDRNTLFHEMMQLLDIPTNGIAFNDERQKLLGKLLARHARYNCESPRNTLKVCQFRRETLRILNKVGLRQDMAYVVRYLGHIWQTPEQTKALQQRALAIFEECDDKQGKVGVLYRLGWAAAQLGQYQEAVQLFEDTLAQAKRLGRQDLTLYCLYDLGYVQWAIGDYQAAIHACRDSITIATEIDNQSDIAIAQRCLARIALSQSDLPTAKAYLQDSIALLTEFGLRGMKAETVGDLANVLAYEQDFAEAEQLAQDTLRQCQELDHRSGEIGPYTVLGEVALGRENYAEAKAYFQNALDIALEVSLPAYALHALVGTAKLLVAIGDEAQALSIATYVCEHSASWHWSKECLAPLVAQLTDTLAPDVVQSAQAWAAEQTLEGIVQALTLEKSMA